MPERLPSARGAESIDKSVLMLCTKNVIINDATVEPKIRMPANDLVGIFNDGPRIHATPGRVCRFVGANDAVCRNYFCGDVVYLIGEGRSDNNISAHFL